MGKKLFLCLSFLIFLTLANAQTVFGDYRDGYIFMKVKNGEFPVAQRSNPRNIPVAAMPSLSNLFRQFGVSKIERPFAAATEDKDLPNVYRVQFTSIHLVNNFISSLQDLSVIDYAEKIPIDRTDATPNDPVIAPHLAQINAYNAWNIFNGNSTVRVAIVDNAVMWNHADLLANTYSNTGETAANNIDDDGNGYVDDIHGFNVADYDPDPAPVFTVMSHGTHCAGIAGATTDNSAGIAAIGWNIRIIPVQCEYDATTTNTAVSNGYDGIVYAVKAGANVISCSWGGSNASTTGQMVVNYAWTRGCIIMASAGNNANSLQNYPGAFNNVYCVASVGSNDLKSSFSNFGSWVDISAPGNTITSTIPYPSTTPLYLQQSGTSMSTPLVAGLAGLMLSKSPQMTRQDVLNCISASAVNIYSLSGNSSYVNLLGAGRIEAYQSMLCAASFSLLPPVANFYAFPRQTCVGTNITLYDSSLYLPTSRSWTFQGGSPATSTLTNPQVSYSATGTYSVGLTVSNGNGQNSITKISYITVVASTPLPYIEGFQNTQFLPTGWTPNNVWNDVAYWERKTGVGGFGASNACSWFNNFQYNVPTERDEMRSPPLNFSNVAVGRLRFDVAYARYDSWFSDTLEVKASNDCGYTWTTIYSRGGSTLSTTSDQSSLFTPTSTQWRRDTINVSALAAGQQNVMFAFINHGHYGQPIYLDNINIATPMPTVNANHSQTVCAGNLVTFTNTSIGAASYTWSLPGSNQAVSNQTSPAVTYSSAGVYTLSLTGANGASVTSITKTITVLNNISISASSASMCSGGSVAISPTGASTYSWYTSGGAFITTSPTLQVNPAATTVYSISATSGGFCNASTTVAINVVNTPTVTVPGVTICSGGTATLIANGASTYSWSNTGTSSVNIVSPGGNTTYTVYGYNNGCMSTQTVDVVIGPALSLQLSATASNVCAGSSATITANGATSYTWTGGGSGNTFTVTPTITTSYTVFGSSGTCTGSGIITIGVSQQPTVNLSSNTGGTICAGGQATLTASGASNYSWSTGQTVPAIVVSPTQTTVYTVIGSNSGCTGTNAITISIGTGSISLAVVASPSMICGGSTTTLTASGATGYQWSNGQTGPMIVVTPSANTTYSLTGTNGGCSGTSTIAILVSGSPVSLLTTTNTSCNTACNGAVNANAAGGKAPYTYSLNGTPATLPVTGLCPGLFTLLTVDSAGCSVKNIFSISATQNNMQAAITGTNASCVTCTDGVLVVNSTGGSQPYTYTWTPSGGNGSTAQGLGIGCYTVTVADAGGCTTSQQACVNVALGISEQENFSVNIYPNPASGFVKIDASGIFAYSVYNHLGQLVYAATGVDRSTMLNVTPFASGIYQLAITIGDKVVLKKLVRE